MGGGMGRGVRRRLGRRRQLGRWRRAGTATEAEARGGEEAGEGWTAEGDGNTFKRSSRHLGGKVVTKPRASVPKRKANHDETGCDAGEPELGFGKKGDGLKGVRAGPLDLRVRRIRVVTRIMRQK